MSARTSASSSGEQPPEEEVSMNPLGLHRYLEGLDDHEQFLGSERGVVWDSRLHTQGGSGSVSFSAPM
jgi:hypothetical protein